VESGRTRSVSSKKVAVQAKSEKNRSPSAKSRSISPPKELATNTDDQHVASDTERSEDVGEEVAPAESDETKTAEDAKDEPKASVSQENRRSWSSLLQTALKDAKSIQGEISATPSTPADFDSVVDRVRNERRLRQRGVQTYGDGYDSTSIVISGCADATISSVLKGSYSYSSTNHGRPVFLKDHAPKDLDVLIYYWDERDGDEFCGWWISPALACDHVWAHHPSRSALSPPGTAWSVPHNEAVDSSFNLVSREATVESIRDEQQREEVEKQWQTIEDRIKTDHVIMEDFEEP